MTGGWPPKAYQSTKWFLQIFWRTADNAFCELSISLCSSSEPQLFIETLVLNIILMIIPPLTATTIKPMTERNQLWEERTDHKTWIESWNPVRWRNKMCSSTNSQGESPSSSETFDSAGILSSLRSMRANVSWTYNHDINPCCWWFAQHNLNRRLWKSPLRNVSLPLTMRMWRGSKREVVGGVRYRREDHRPL